MVAHVDMQQDVIVSEANTQKSNLQLAVSPRNTAQTRKPVTSYGKVLFSRETRCRPLRSKISVLRTSNSPPLAPTLASPLAPTLARHTSTFVLNHCC